MKAAIIEIPHGRHSPSGRLVSSEVEAVHFGFRKFRTDQRWFSVISGSSNSVPRPATTRYASTDANSTKDAVMALGEDPIGVRTN